MSTMSLTPEQARLRKIQKKTGRPSLTIDTDMPESIHSDEPDPPSSPHCKPTAPARHGVSFEVLFPCLKAPMRLLRVMTQPEQLDEMKTIVPVFCSSVGSITKSMTASHFLLTSCAMYMEIENRVSRKNLELGTHVAAITTADALEAMSTALKLIHSITKDLSLMLRAMETYQRAELKPLPPLPQFEFSDSFLDASIFEEFMPGDNSSSESPTSDSVSGESQSTLLACDSKDSLPLSTAPKKNKSKFVFRVLRIARHSPKAASETLTITDQDAASSSTSLFSSTTTLTPSELPYTARQSLYYNCADPLHPDHKIDMPLPVGDTVAIRLDSHGDVKAASLPALIQLLTSHHHLDEEAFRRTFFLSFRLFSTPPRVLRAFRSRWNELPPEGLMTAAQRRVWLQHMLHVRTRLAELILLWLDEYWRPSTDSVVIEPLRMFVKTCFVRGVVPRDLPPRILAALDRAEAESEAHTPRLRRARETQREGPLPPPLAAMVPFDIVLRAEDDYTLNISVFETAAGRKRFAEQLTAVAHNLFRTIDAEGAVAAWATGVPFFHELQRFEQDLLYWVAQSILELEAREERVCMMEFWFDVATTCVEFRNFSSASAIFGGLVFSPVERLSRTILDLAIPSKEQYRKLNALFDGANNFAIYRRTLAGNDFPAVPLLSIFHKDTVSLTEISGPIALTDDPDAEKSLIHVSVFRILEKTIRTMEASLAPYQIDRIPMIQDWIQAQLAVQPRADDAVQRMDELSHALEGRAPHPIQKGQVWLVTVKGNIETGAFTLHTLPEPSAAPAPTLRKNKSIATLLNLRTKRK